MIGRLVHALAFLAVWFCVGTVLSAIVLGTVITVKWNIDRSKVVKMIAIAQGVDLTPPAPPVDRAREASPEQVSYGQVLEARVDKFRDIELREQALRNNLVQLRADQARLAEDRSALAKSRETFLAELAQSKNEAVGEGWEQNRASLAALKPKQAKELLLIMLGKNEINDVVALLAPMADSKRAKIFAEFKTPEECQKVDEILRLIRSGDPRAAAAVDARRQLEGFPPGNEGTKR